MDTYLAYCSACDSEVLVKLERGASRVEPGDVTCLDEEEGCSDERAPCPLRGVPASQIANRLEFVPLPKTAPSVSGLRAARALLERARRASFGRRFRHTGGGE